MNPKWIWYPEQRSLPNTFVFFRREFDYEGGPATGTLAADSRYRLYVNGVEVQRGPAPFDPRYQELEEFDLAPHLVPGRNVIGVLVMSFGHAGDGTYIPGSPGLRFESPDLGLVSDSGWRCLRARCWAPGGPRRSYLRAFQEVFDARLYPDDWGLPGFDDSGWRPALELDASADRPLIGGPVINTMAGLGSRSEHLDCRFRYRTIPHLKCEWLPASRFLASGMIDWLVPPEEYLEAYTLDGVKERIDKRESAPAVFPLELLPEPGSSAAALFELPYEITGHPRIVVEAEAGTIVELFFDETRGQGVLPNEKQWKGQFVRLICREGVNDFAAFDWEAVKFLTVAVRGTNRPVRILELGAERLLYPFLHEAKFSADPALERVYRGAVNTLRNISLEAIIDNAARERQQYAGEVTLNALPHYLAFGEFRLARRVLQTLADGQHPDGWFFDCYPCIDRMERQWQNALGLFRWGSLVDHALALLFHIHSYTLFSGDFSLAAELKEKVLRFDRWLESMRQRFGGLLPTTEEGPISVWMDTKGYLRQRHKEAALNIYLYGAVAVALKGIYEFLDLPLEAASCERRGAELKELVLNRFGAADGTIVDNLPWLAEEGNLRRHDRTLSMALLWGVYREESGRERMVELLKHPPADQGFSHPPNAYWRFRALDEFGGKEYILRELRERWAGMTSLTENGTFSEQWPEEMGPNSAWCQCASSGPLYAFYQAMLGVTPLAPGFALYRLRPYLGEGEYSGLCYLADECVEVSWRQGVLELRLPPGKTAVIELPHPLRRAKLNGADAPDWRGKRELRFTSDSEAVLLTIQ